MANLFLLTWLRLAQCELLTKNLIKMSKRCELQKEYYQQYGNYKGNGKYCDKYVSWLENEVLALRQPPVSGRSEQLKCDCGNTENVKLIPICPCCYNPHSGEW